MQTLTTLDVGYNDIGDQGVEHIATALQQNEVNFVSSPSFHFNNHLYISHRHLPHLLLERMKSIRKEHNILLTLCNTTK
jgi:hypothetical protein